MNVEIKHIFNRGVESAVSFFDQLGKHPLVERIQSTFSNLEKMVQNQLDFVMEPADKYLDRIFTKFKIPEDPQERHLLAFGVLSVTTVLVGTAAALSRGG